MLRKRNQSHWLRASFLQWKSIADVSKSKAKAHKLPHIVPLEDRVLFSAAPISPEIMQGSLNGTGDVNAQDLDNIWKQIEASTSQLDQVATDLFSLDQSSTSFQSRPELSSLFDGLVEMTALESLDLEAMFSPQALQQFDASSLDLAAELMLLDDVDELILSARQTIDSDEALAATDRTFDTGSVTSAQENSATETGDDSEPGSNSTSPFDAATNMLPAVEAPTHLIIVDLGVEDYATLLESTLAGLSHQSFAIAYIDSTQDGISQLGNILGEYRDLQAVHLVTHGADGLLQLGSSQFDLQSLEQHSQSIAQWRQSFAEDGDLLIYGCDVAASDQGIALINRWSQLMSVDIAASNDITGHSDLGGDWDLEVTIGDVNHGLPVSRQPLSWHGTLATYVVTNASSGTGNGTLGWAIQQSNSTTTKDTITFNIGGTDLEIDLFAALPNITNSVTIDGTTQPGFTGLPRIVIDGNAAGDFVAGLTIKADDVTVKGLSIVRFSGSSSSRGIVIDSSSNVVIQGMHVGIDDDGTSSRGNDSTGIYVTNSSNVQIGGTGANEGNLISANDGDGIWAEFSSNLTIQGNVIGLNLAGTSDRGNGETGIQFDSVSDSLIGGSTPSARNVISGNSLRGILLYGDNHNIDIFGNMIGTNAAGNSDIKNGYYGIEVDNSYDIQIGGDFATHGNLISGNGWDGIAVHGSNSFDVTIQGNRIGTNALGTSAIGNYNGINIYDGAHDNLIGGSLGSTGNLISGNYLDGIVVFGSGTTNNTIIGNLIGVNAAGTSALANGSDGIWIGHASNTQIGGDSPSERNIISGNQHAGIRVTGGGAQFTQIQGNYIGTNLNATSAIGNRTSGIVLCEQLDFSVWTGSSNTLIGGALPSEGNVIAGNLSHGIQISGDKTTDVLVQNNFIGLNSASVAIANGGNGIRICQESDLSGTKRGAPTRINIGTNGGNTIANQATGINVVSGSQVAINQNRIVNYTTQAIDRGLNGITPNDANDSDTTTNYPLITSASTDGLTTRVTGTLQTKANITGIIIEFFSSSVAHGSGHGEAQQFLGSITVNSDPSGLVTFDQQLTLAVPVGHVVSATATVSGETSELSGNAVVTAAQSSAQIWFSTKGFASSGSAAWSPSNVAKLADPGLNLEPNGGNTTGTLDLLDGLTWLSGVGELHYVHQNLTLGTTGNKIDLNIGDLILVPEINGAMAEIAASLDLIIGDDDVMLFRPDVPGDYSSGTWIKLLEAPAELGGIKQRISALTLVEQSTTIGGTTLAAGTFLVSIDNGNLVDNVYTFSASSVGDGTTSTTQLSLLLDGDALGFANQALQSLELIEKTVSVNGTILNIGTLLASIDTTGSAVIGSNSLAVEGEDVFALQVTSTEQVALGSTAATATKIIDGSDIGLESGSDTENINSLTVIFSNNIAPVISSIEAVPLDYLENSGEVIVSNTISIVDTDDVNLQSARIHLIGSSGSATERLNFVNQLGITHGWNSTTGVLTLTGLASVSDYEAAFRSITYLNTSENPTTTLRSVSFEINDGKGFSTNAMRSISVKPINDAPVFTPSAPSLLSINEDAVNNGGNTIASVISGSVFDAESTSQVGIAITSLNSGNGLWQFSIDNGVFWNDLPAASNSSALLLRPEDRIRFVPNTENGTTATFQFVAWDQSNATLGKHGSFVSIVGNRGGTNAFSVNSDIAKIDVTSLNDIPTISTTNFTFAENSTLVGDVVASDIDAPAQVLSYSLTSFADSKLFDIDSKTGRVTALTQLDFENSTDANDDGIYTIQVVVTDSVGASTMRNISISVSDVNEQPTILSSTFSVDENSTTVGSLVGTDVDAGDVWNWSLDGTGLDNSLFSIDSMSGALTFNQLPDFELPLDADENNLYQVAILATDSKGLQASRTIDVEVFDVNEQPNLSFANVTIPERTFAVGTATATDPDSSDVISYSLKSGFGDNHRFTIDESTGEIRFKQLPNFESPRDANRDNIYELQIVATDQGGLTDLRTVQVTVSDVNEAPTVLAGTLNISEGSTNVTWVGQVNGSDIDQGDSLVWQITDGNSSGLFSIDQQGRLTLTAGANLDYELTPNFQLTVMVTDSQGLNDQALIDIVVDNVNEAPVIQNGHFLISEKSPNSTVVGPMIASDVDFNDSVTYSIVAGQSSQIFTINASTGEISVNQSSKLDYESRSSYKLAIRATDASGLVDTAFARIDLTDINEAPVARADSLIATAGQTRVIQTSELLVNDVDPEQNPLGVSIVSMPTHGTLVQNSKGEFEYIPDSSFAGTDSFIYVAGDGSLQSSTTRVTIVVAGAPASNLPPDDTTPEPDKKPKSDGESLNNGNTGNGDSKSPPANGGGTQSINGTGGISGTASIGLVPTIRIDGVSENSTTEEGDGIQSQSFESSGGSSRVGMRSSSWNSETVMQASFAATSLNVGMNIDSFALLSANANMWLDLKEMKDEITFTPVVQNVVITSVAGFSSALTVGYVLWLVRGGYLVASVLSALPAWRFVDPLTIIDTLDDDPDAGEDDSIQAMLEQKND
jgi:Domain of unknown function (DUF4347)/Bacterial Ig domain/Cadherin domain/Right handed beta helix region